MTELLLKVVHLLACRFHLYIVNVKMMKDGQNHELIRNHVGLINISNWVIRLAFRKDIGICFKDYCEYSYTFHI